MFSVKRRWLGRIEVAARKGSRVLRIVEPETQMERIRGGQSHVWVKAEDIVEENRFYLDVTVICPFANLDIGLIPSQAEASGEIRVFGAIGLKEAVLHGEEVKRKAWFDPIQIQNERVVLLATDDCGASPRLLIRIGAKTVNDRRIRQKIEGDFVFLFFLVLSE